MRIDHYLKTMSGCLLVFSLFLSCEIINPEETAPTIIHLEEFDFQVSPGQGTDNNRIPEVWVYANSTLVGAFTPPVDIHYLGEGPTTVNFRPGIRNNGIQNTAITYPLFDFYSTQFEATPGSRVDVSPTTRYVAGAKFGLVEDFEVTNAFVDNRDTVAGPGLTVSQEEVFEGNNAGRIRLTEENYFVDIAQILPLNDLPVNGNPAYLEMRYKSEVEFSIGLYGIDLTGQYYENFFYLVKPTDEWNQLYIQLDDRVRLSGLPSYKVAFRALYLPSTGQEELNIYLDNIKVVYL